MPASTAQNRVSRPVTTAQLFHALSDETRLAVLDMLREGERCVCDLQGALDAAQSRLSFHLKVLRDAGLVTDRKQGRWSYYALNTGRVAEAEAHLTKLQDVRVSSPTIVPLARATSASATKHASARAIAGASSDDACCS